MRTAPDYIQFYPTLRCNRASDFCFNRGITKMDDMAPAEFRVMVDELQKLGVKRLDIIGGEPTLHIDLPLLIAYAFQQGMEQGKPTLLEPIMRVDISAPSEYVGDLMGDLNSRRGRVEGVDAEEDTQTIHARVPMAEMLTYGSTLRSTTRSVSRGSSGAGPPRRPSRREARESSAQADLGGQGIFMLSKRRRRNSTFSCSWILPKL